MISGRGDSLVFVFHDKFQESGECCGHSYWPLISRYREVLDFLRRKRDYDHIRKDFRNELVTNACIVREHMLNMNTRLAGTCLFAFDGTASEPRALLFKRLPSKTLNF